MSEDHRLEEEWPAKLLLVRELEGDVLADHVAIVDEEEDPFTQRRAVRLAQVLVKLLIKLHVVVRVHVEHPIRAIRLVDVVEEVKAIRAKMAHEQVTHLVDGRLFEDAAQVDEHVEARERRLRATLVRHACTALGARHGSRQL